MIARLSLVLLQAGGEVAAKVPELNAFSWIFMLVSMGGVTILTFWSFHRILRSKQHFDPDGTGPASPPIPGRAEKY